MDPRLLSYYNRELQHVREMGAEFAREYPKIAGRLGLEGFDCADPYVERLLEGFAFLAARVQLKVDAEFPRFSQHLLERVYPHYLPPVPSMLVAQFEPDFSEGALAEGVDIPRHTAMRSILGKDDRTACIYRTAHPLKIWPIAIAEVEYLGTSAAVNVLGIEERRGLRAGIRLRLRLHGDKKFSELPIEQLELYLRGSEGLPMRLYEQIFANNLGFVALPCKRPAKWQAAQPRSAIRQVGFDDEQSLIPYGARSFQGYRLLQEYFAFPQRFLFVALANLQAAFARCADQEIDIVVLLNESDPILEASLDANNFALYCSPAINLFPKRTDRIHLDQRQSEYHVVPDRTRPMDFEIHSITEVTGHGVESGDEQSFWPFYAATDVSRRGGEHLAFYTVHRVPRIVSSTQRRKGPRSSYIGSEVFITLVDGREAPFRSDLRQLSLGITCTNRDLPLHMPLGLEDTDFTLDAGGPVKAVRCVAGPTKPRASSAEREFAWRLISHLTLNYLSILDNDGKQGATALREMLRLYGDLQDASVRMQIDEGVRSVRYKSVTRRMPIPGPIAFGRGLEITLSFDEAAFEGSGVFILGAVLERFFARYASINMFTQTTIRTETRGEIIRWPVRSGMRHVL